MASDADKNRDRVLKCIEAAEKNQKTLVLEWQRMYDAYLGKPEQTKTKLVGRRKWGSKLNIKHAFQQVETLLPEFLVEDPNFEVVPVEHSDADRARTVQKLLDYQLGRDRYAEKRMQVVKKAIIFGACPIKVTWAYDKRTMKIRNPMTADQRVQVLLDASLSPEEKDHALAPFSEQDVTLKDDPTMVVVDPFDFMWDPAATCIDDAEYVLHRSWLSDDQLKAKEKAGLYTGVTDLLKGSKSGVLGGLAKRLTGETEEESQAKRGDRHEVIEKWTRDRLVVIVDRKVIVRDTENPYWHGKLPFVMAVTQPDVDKVTGLSEVWSIDALQDHANYVFNAQRDALDMTLDPPLALRSNDPRLKEFDLRPGVRVFVDDPSAVKPIDIGQASAYATTGEVDRIVGWMERSTGINASISGGSSEGTATEAAMNLRQGKSRIANKVFWIDRALARAAEMFIQLDQQFIDQERVVRIVGPEAQWQTVSPQDIAGQYDVLPQNSTERGLKELAREQSLNILNAFAQFAGMGVNIWPLIDKAAQAHDIDPESLHPQQQPAQPQQQDIVGGQQPVQEGAVEQASPDGLDSNGFAPDALTQG